MSRDRAEFLRDLAFDFEFIFPERLFEDEVVAATLASVGIHLKSRGNHMALFTQPEGVAAFMAASDEVKKMMWDAGWGMKLHGGKDLAGGDADGTFGFLSDKIGEIIAARRTGQLSEEQLKPRIFELLYFISETMKGRVGGVDVAQVAWPTDGRTPKAIDPMEARALIGTARMLLGIDSPAEAAAKAASGGRPASGAASPPNLRGGGQVGARPEASRISRLARALGRTLPN